MEGASKITYTLLWQFFDTSKFNRNIYYLLLYSNIFQGHFKIGRALPQLHKNCETFYIQVSCCKNSFWSIWGACTNIIKKDCIHDALIYIWTKKHKKQPYRFTANCWQSFLFHHRIPSTSCWTVLYCWQLLQTVQFPTICFKLWWLMPKLTNRKKLNEWSELYLRNCNAHYGDFLMQENCRQNWHGCWHHYLQPYFPKDSVSWLFSWMILWGGPMFRHQRPLLHKSRLKITQNHDAILVIS